ncbi:MAG TPA: calcineurin-like phosphoesterase family protein [Pseudoxanthomonas sp.]|nr:calcineurin-like phosphoesterase family protein [Pseudoxanthomonas sp.]
MRPRFAPILFVLLAWAGPSHAAGAGAVAAGVVYVEFDGRPGQGEHENGVPGVLVSNGRELVRTDAQGRYRLPVRPGQTVFVVKPDGFRFVARADGLPDFWRHHFPDGSPRLRFGGIPRSGADRDFALHPPVPGPAADIDVLVFADTQVKHARDVDHYRRDIVEPLSGRHAAAFGTTLGDLVDDDLSLYPALNAATAKLGTPWFHVPGNHDLDFDAARDEDSLLTWRNAYGPDTYAVEEGGASFVFLDDVVYLPGQRPAYVGGLREDQFAFLEAYLATLPRDRLVVLGLHIPLFQDGARETFRRADRERLFALLQRFERVLVLSGHSHTQRHHYHGLADGWHGAAPLHEYNVGAACGAFWSGAPDAAGIPDATMADGTPNGYAVLHVRRAGGYALAWHPARVPAADPAFTGAMALHAPRVLRRGAYPAWGVYANVFMGDADTRVEYRIDGGPWRPMQRVERPDPRLVVENVADDLAPALRGHDRSPEAVPSTHLWRGALATDLPAGEHRVEVRASGRWVGEASAATVYWLAEAAD